MVLSIEEMSHLFVDVIFQGHLLLLSVLLPCFKNIIVYSLPVLGSWLVSILSRGLVKNNILLIIIKAC